MKKKNESSLGSTLSGFNHKHDAFPILFSMPLIEEIMLGQRFWQELDGRWWHDQSGALATYMEGGGRHGSGLIQFTRTRDKDPESSALSALAVTIAAVPLDWRH